MPKSKLLGEIEEQIIEILSPTGLQGLHFEMAVGQLQQLFKTLTDKAGIEAYNKGFMVSADQCRENEFYLAGIKEGVWGFVDFIRTPGLNDIFDIDKKAEEYLSQLKETSLKGYELVHTCKPDKNGYAICCCCTYKPVKETSPEEGK